MDDIYRLSQTQLAIFDRPVDDIEAIVLDNQDDSGKKKVKPNRFRR